MKHKEELHGIKSKLLIQERINEGLLDKWNKHLTDLEDKLSLEQKIQASQDSIQQLTENQHKLNKMKEKYANMSTEKDILTITETTQTIVKMNQYERSTI